MRGIAAYLTIGLFAAGLFPGAVAADSKTTVNWPSYRGPRAGGIALGPAPPTTWNVETGENVLWKTAIPGLGHSSPIVWGDRIFVTTAISGKQDEELKVGLYGNVDPVKDDTAHEWRLYCLNKKTGEVVWQRTLFEGLPKIKRHTKASHANSTPATDGHRVVVNLGSEGLYAYDFDGKLLWKKDLGLLDSGWYRAPEAQWGFGSSPIIEDGMVIVQCDVQKDSFLAALDVKDGREVWRSVRDEVPGWASPNVYEEQGQSVIVVNGFKHIGGYQARTGRAVWRMSGGGDIPVPTPVVAGDLIYITNAHGEMSPIYAVSRSARGDITLTDGATSNEHVIWSRRGGGAYMQTPLVWGDRLFVCRDNGVLTCYDRKTGSKLGQRRLGTGNMGFTASAVAADGKLYYSGEMGEVRVVRADPELELLATNEMGEICMATPAISEGTLFFRTRGHLVAVGSPRPD